MNNPYIKDVSNLDKKIDIICDQIARKDSKQK